MYISTGRRGDPYNPQRETRETKGTTGDEENGEKREKNAKTKEKAKAVSRLTLPYRTYMYSVANPRNPYILHDFAFFPLRNIYLLGGYAAKHIYITLL